MQNQHFYSASDFYKRKFGCKVYKVSIDAGCTCPNRDGTKGVGGCIFCSPAGSGDFASSPSLSVRKQIAVAKKLVEGKNRRGKYIAYFQNFTNTYGDEYALLRKYYEACGSDDVVGVAVATRPDCISRTMLEGLSLLCKKTFVSLELGLQTSNERTAEYIRRCYKNSEYVSAVDSIKNICPDIHIVTHIIFGLPGESKDDMLDTVRLCVSAGTDGMKISLLHVLKSTELLVDYEAGLFRCLSMQEYFDVVSDALEIIPEDVVLHRLTGDGAKKDLVAPLWSADKKKVYNSMMRYFEENGVVQGLKADWTAVL